MKPPLKLHDVSARYGAKQVLSEVSLALLPGESIALLGINGAGKSTLIKSLLDLNDIEAGSIEIFGVDHRRTQARSAVSYLAENFQAPYFARGADYLRYMTALHGVSLDQAAIEMECESFALEAAVLAQPMREYSKGMRQKLGLIACLVVACPLLVLDEPMSGLDPLARSLFKTRLARLKRDQQSLFFSTHQLDDVDTLCDRVAVLHEGRIRYIGPLEDFKSTYAAATLEASFLRCISAEEAA